MRVSRFVAIAAVLCLACSDSTGIRLQGPSFMRAQIDGSPFSLDENDAFVWAVNGTMLMVQGLPGTIQPVGNQYIHMQVADYRGPGTYELEQDATPGANEGIYGVFDGSFTPTASYQTLGQHKGSLRILAEDARSGTLVGTFEFSAISNMGGSSEVHITQGSFRIRH
ncbi:MAG TPA: DUF6252 family protein [Gemmatimonadales bacterium]|nr:DUF6252 family protein [Gemmatimonadales bacterium]